MVEHKMVANYLICNGGCRVWLCIIWLQSLMVVEHDMVANYLVCKVAVLCGCAQDCG